MSQSVITRWDTPCQTNQSCSRGSQLSVPLHSWAVPGLVIFKVHSADAANATGSNRLRKLLHVRALRHSTTFDLPTGLQRDGYGEVQAWPQDAKLNSQLFLRTGHNPLRYNAPLSQHLRSSKCMLTQPMNLTPQGIGSRALDAFHRTCRRGATPRWPTSHCVFFRGTRSQLILVLPTASENVPHCWQQRPHGEDDGVRFLATSITMQDQGKKLLNLSSHWVSSFGSSMLWLFQNSLLRISWEFHQQTWIINGMKLIQNQQFS